MININFNQKSLLPQSITKAKTKTEITNNDLKLNPALSKDSFSFTGGISSGVVSDMQFKSVLENQLVSEPSPTFEKDLKAIGVISFDAAKTRVSSLSRYLKEDMVGFVVPKYETAGVEKGGYQWFEKGAEYLIRGSKEGVQESDFKPVAKELYGLLATHDNYWRSPKFVEYLSSLEQTPAVAATISAVKELGQSKDLAFTGGEVLKMFGYYSPMKAMDKLLKDGCAYSGNSLQFDDPATKHPQIAKERNASLEHIMPKSWGGPCDDSNYMVTAQQANSSRANMGLIQYLKGSSAGSSGS